MGQVREYEIAKEVDEIGVEIKKRGGVMAIANGTTVKEYLKYFVKKGELKQFLDCFFLMKVL